MALQRRRNAELCNDPSDFEVRIRWRSSVVPTVRYTSRSIKRASVYILVVLTPQCRSPALPEAIRRPSPSPGGVQDVAAAGDARTSMRGAATRPGPAAAEIVRTR